MISKRIITWRGLFGALCAAVAAILGMALASSASAMNQAYALFMGFNADLGSASGMKLPVGLIARFVVIPPGSTCYVGETAREDTPKLDINSVPKTIGALHDNVLSSVSPEVRPA